MDMRFGQETLVILWDILTVTRTETDRHNITIFRDQVELQRARVMKVVFSPGPKTY